MLEIYWVIGKNVVKYVKGELLNLVLMVND